MIYTENIKIGLRDVDKNLNLKDSAILEYLENIATRHADSLCYGINNNTENGVSWVLLDWDLKKIQSIKYGQHLTVKTWSKSIEKCYGYRNFELYNEDGVLCVVAASKWLLINTTTKGIVKASEKLINDFDSHPEKTVLDCEDFKKINIPETFEITKTYKVQRRDIDLLGHVHNVYYLDFAYEILPQEVYDSFKFTKIRISYRKEIKFEDTIKLKLSSNNKKYTLVMENVSNNTIHSVIELE